MESERSEKLRENGGIPGINMFSGRNAVIVEKEGWELMGLGNLRAHKKKHYKW